MRRKKIRPLQLDKDYIYGAKEISKILIEHYNAHFSERNKINKITEELNDIGDLSDIDFS